MRLALSLTCAAATTLAGTIAAQDSLVFCMDGDEVTLDNASGLVEAGLIRQDETAIVTPGPGAYSAAPFHTMNLQWGYLGDADGDGRVCDSSSGGPGDDTDAVFVKRFPASPAGSVTPREVFLSKEGNAGFDTSTFEDGDVFRYASQGALEVFVTEAMLLDAIGAPTGDVDVDAICQTDQGDLFLSFADTETLPGGSSEDGDIIFIPASAITYDASFNVSAIASGTAEVVLTEDDVIAFTANSLMLTSVGGTPSTSIDTTALELDPAGGTFTSPTTLGTYPNIWFAWSGFSNDGAVLSTAGGGSLASLNGALLASDVATTGAQLGLTPDSTGLGGLMGMALVPGGSNPLTVENHPTSLITSSTILWSRQEVSGATPGSPVVFFTTLGAAGAGVVPPAIGLPGFGGVVYGNLTPYLLGTVNADAGGYAGNVFTLPTVLVGSAAHLMMQAFDFAAFSFGEPAPIQFL